MAKLKMSNESSKNKPLFNPSEAIWGFSSICLRIVMRDEKSYSDIHSFTKSEKHSINSLEILDKLLRFLKPGSELKTYYTSILREGSDPDKFFIIEKIFVEDSLRKTDKKYLLNRFIILYDFFKDVEYFNETLNNLKITIDEIKQKREEILNYEKKERKRSILKRYIFRGISLGCLIGLIIGGYSGCRSFLKPEGIIDDIFVQTFYGLIIGGLVGIAVGILIYQSKKEKQFEILNCDGDTFGKGDIIEKIYNFNKFDKKDLVEVTETEEDINEEPVRQAKGKKLYYIIGIIVVALIVFYFYAESSDSITFINRKGKAEKHLKAGTEIFQAQMNSQAPDMQALQNALAEFNKTLEFEPNNIDALFSKAIITTSSGNFPDAITDLDKIIGLSPDFPDAYFYRGFCKLQQGDFQNSLADFNKNLELNPENMSAVFYRANTKYLIKDFTGAKEDMNKIIEKNPQVPNGYALRGLCDVELGNKNSGCEDFKKAKELGFPEADSLIKLHCK